MGPSLFVVTGATGNIGQALTEQLLAQGHAVRAIARGAERLKALASKGAEAHAGSVGDAGFLAQAFKGADGAFVMVPPDYTSERMLDNQRAVVDAEVAALKASGVPRVVALSSIGAYQPSGTGPIVTLHYLEGQLNTLDGVDVVALRAASFMENFLQSIGLIKSMGVNGGSTRPDVAAPMVATRDVAATAAARLVGRDFSGKSVRYVLGPRDLTFAEATQILGQAIGRPDLQYVEFSYDDERKGLIGAGLPPSVADLFIEMHRAANDRLTAPTQPRSDDNTTATTLEEWSKVFAAAYKGASKTA
jgi:uncharacterized protein YbjT (DUF2867 family)